MRKSLGEVVVHGFVCVSFRPRGKAFEKGLEAGFFRYLTKPIEVREFMDALDVALHYAAEHGLAGESEK